MEDFPLWAAAFFTFLGVLATALLNFFIKKNKQNLDANQTLIQNVFTEIGRLQNRIDSLEKERDELLDELATIRQENAELRAENKILQKRIDELSVKDEGGANL
jgi:peptidoglycan hydrolase CwlO-like protein